MKRVEHDPGWGWIARDRNGSEIGGKDFRWASRSVARSVVLEAGLIDQQEKTDAE